MYLFIILFIIAAAVQREKSCEALCRQDGPKMCSKGSFETDEGYCMNYFVKSDFSEHCYSLTSAEECARDNPLTSESAGRLLVRMGLWKPRRLSDEDPFADVRPFSLGDSPRMTRMRTGSRDEAWPEVVVGVDFLGDAAFEGSENASSEPEEDLAQSALCEVINVIINGWWWDLSDGSLWEAALEDMNSAAFDPSREDWSRWNVDGLIKFSKTSAMDNHPLKEEILIVTFSLVAYISGLYSTLSSSILETSRIREMCASHRATVKEAIQSHFSFIWRDSIRWVQDDKPGRIFESVPLARANRVCPEIFDTAEMRQIVFAHRMQQIVWDDFFPTPRKQLFEINRDTLVADSLNRVMGSSSARLRAGIVIQFTDEEGLDRGGLLRDWFSQFAQEIFDPEKHPFFQPLDHDRNTYRIVKQASISSLNVLRGIGRMIALSIHHKSPLGVKLPLTLWEQMLGNDSILSSETVQADDPVLFKALRTLLDTDLSSPDGIHLTNGLTMNPYSDSLEADIPVTEDNKLEYVGSLIQHRFKTSIEKEIAAFASGFTDIVPLDRFQDLLDPHDLNLMLRGESFIDVADLENHTRLVGYFDDSPQVIWFWELLYDSSVFTQKKLHELLRFATGDSSVPLGGFRNLREFFKLGRVTSMNPDQRLPTASTCFFTLDLPEYSNKDILRTKLIQAIELTSGFDLTL